MGTYYDQPKQAVGLNGTSSHEAPYLAKLAWLTTTQKGRTTWHMGLPTLSCFRQTNSGGHWFSPKISQVLSSNPMKSPIILFPSLRVVDYPIKSPYFYIFLLQVVWDSHGFTIDTAKRKRSKRPISRPLYIALAAHRPPELPARSRGKIK
jgi:hypothetical protein